MSDTQSYKQFGNSVVVPLMANIADLVRIKMQELDAGELVKGEISETLKAENCKKEVKKKTAIIKQKELAVV